MFTPEISDRHQGLFDSYAERLRELAVREIAGGGELDDFVLLLFDMDDPVTAGLVGEAAPGLLSADIEPPPGHSVVICASCGPEDARRLADTAEMADSLSVPRPDGAIDVLTFTEGSIAHYHLFLIPLDSAMQ